VREHRLYEVDWLVRRYGFRIEEIFEADDQLDLAIDPKLAWALSNRAGFPVDVNRAAREMLLRVPGFGTKAVDRIIQTRRHRRLRLEDVGRLCASVAKVRPFIVAEGWSPGRLTDDSRLRERLAPAPRQLALF
jgi:predicted DNA-binding helix-hairpin-helix protein